MMKQTFLYNFLRFLQSVCMKIIFHRKRLAPDVTPFLNPHLIRAGRFDIGRLCLPITGTVRPRRRPADDDHRTPLGFPLVAA